MTERVAFCAHQVWEPLEGWIGRYRCTGCSGVGHVDVSQEGGIIAYLCAKRIYDISTVGGRKVSKGRACGRIAVKVGAYASKNRCAEHR